MNAADRPLSGLSVLVLEDEALFRRRLTAHLENLGADVYGADSIAAARRSLTDAEFDFALLDVNLPDGSGMDLVRQGAIPGGTGTVLMTAQGAIQDAVEAIRLGAIDYLVKPFDPALLALVMRRARQARQLSRAAEHVLENESTATFFFGSGLAALRNQLDLLLAADHRLEKHLPPVLILGETGTGKSSLARWIHRQGPRQNQPLIEVNCSALPDSLAESELLGHERGAFTDARTARQGLFEAAHGGTLFLDELPSLSAAVQAKILTALEDRTIRRLGGNRQIQVDVRIIAATSRNLREAVASGEFREDLLHRLDLYRLQLPPLRERQEDLPALAEHLLRGLCARYRLPLRRITPAGLQRMLAYPWPGNIRELSHELERELVFQDAASLEFNHLTSSAPNLATPTQGDWLNPGFAFPEEGFALEEAINRLVQLALRQSGSNVSEAARRLGVTRDYIRYRLHGGRKDKPPEVGTGLASP